MSRTRSIRATIVLATAALCVCGPLAIASAAEAEQKPDGKLYDRTVDKAIDYLRTKGQSPDGSFSPRIGPAVTAIVVTGLIRNGRSLDDPMVGKGLKFLTGFVRDDGGIYAEDSRIKNYETCVVLMAFAEANQDHRYDKIIKNADAYIRGLQAEGSKKGPAELGYGGVGYGGATRPDLSNTAFLVDALKAAGAGADDKAIQEAWSSSRGVRISNRSTTPRPGPPRIPTAVSITRRWLARGPTPSGP